MILAHVLSQLVDSGIFVSCGLFGQLLLPRMAEYMLVHALKSSRVHYFNSIL